MRIVRICLNGANLSSGALINLSEDAFGHACRVLRLKDGDPLRIFDGRGHEFDAVLTQVSAKSACALIGNPAGSSVESPLYLELGQVISRGDKMEFTLQKAVELGAAAFVPLLSERCGVKLDPRRMEKKNLSYLKIAAGACEQCGRSVLPAIEEVTELAAWCARPFDGISLTLDPYSGQKITALPPFKRCRLLIGPEGGLSAAETALACRCGFTGVTLGPRILRTETAALVALSILGSRFGDL